MMKNNVAIICGGEYSPLRAIETANFIIACDKGLEYAINDGIKPDLLVGDFDSYKGIIPQDIKRLDLPVEKDDTDTMAAVRYAVEEGYQSITLYCALGGRLDHLLGNIQVATYIAKNNKLAHIVDDNNEMYFINNSSVKVNKRDGYSLSILSMSEISKGVSIEGAKYSLCDYTMTNSFPIGVSNEWKENEVKVSVKDGIIIVMLSKM